MTRPSTTDCSRRLTARATAAEAKAARFRLRDSVAALRGLNVRLHLAGKVLSFIGSFVQNFAQWWLVLSITDSRSESKADGVRFQADE